MTWLHVRRRPPQQIRPGRGGPCPQREPAEPAIGEHEHRRLQPVDRLAGEGVLQSRVGHDDGLEIAWTWMPHSSIATTRAWGNHRPLARLGVWFRHGCVEFARTRSGGDVVVDEVVEFAL